MPVDYSKWDTLELSDDSDIEVHPNVDKKSFIRAKQAQIHQQRAQRKHEIQTLKYERIINDGLLLRIGRLLTTLKSHKPDSSTSADDLVLQSVVESINNNPEDDKPPPPPAGVHGNTEQPVYSKMMQSLIYQVIKEVDEQNPNDRLPSFVTGIEAHKTKVQDLQVQLVKKLDVLEAEESKHITSEKLTLGFDHSAVSKQVDEEKSNSANNSKMELLNPQAVASQRLGSEIDEGAGAATEDEDPDDIKPTAAALKFCKIPSSDYVASLRYLKQEPSILEARNIDALLVQAFNAQLDGDEKLARQSVHQALLIQYCRQLGRDGVDIFFKRITTPNHQASTLFKDDVSQTYKRIQTRVAEIKKERDTKGHSEGVETIQLHTVDPGTTINIQVPRPIPTNITEQGADSASFSESEIAARKIFDSFSPKMRKALEKRNLEEVNKVLADMSVEEAEQVVVKLSEGGILNVEEGLVDTTTEEGQKIFEEINKTHHLPEAQPSSGTLQD